MSETVKYVGCYKQRARDLAARAADGFNLVVMSEPESGTVPQSVWRKAARDAGLMYIDTYLSDDDATDPNLLAWALTNSDEWNRARGPSAVRQPLAPMIAEAQKLQAINAAKGTNKPIYANADGPGVTFAIFEKPPYNGVKNGEKGLLPYLGIRSVDWYPVVATASTDPAVVAGRQMYLPAQAAWRMRTWSDEIQAPPALYFVIIEAAKNWKAPLGVTGAQMREQVDYLMGRRSFPVPADATGKAVQYQGQVADGVIFWTANGQDGPGWNWYAGNDEQQTTMRALVSELKGSPLPTPPPNPNPPRPTPSPRSTPASTASPTSSGRRSPSPPKRRTTSTPCAPRSPRSPLL
jgi:hypothetical protein